MSADFVRLEAFGAPAPCRNRHELIGLVGKRLRLFRAQRAICIHALAVRCDVSLATLQALEAEQLSDLDFCSVKRIAQAVGVEVGELFVDD
jgi:hypothetical protein